MSFYKFGGHLPSHHHYTGEHISFRCKMEVLHWNLFLLEFLGLYTDETCNRTLQSVRYVFFLLGVTCSASVCSGVYLYYHFSDLMTATNALIVLTAGMAGSTAFITFGMNSNEIKEIYRTLRPMVNTGESLNIIAAE